LDAFLRASKVLRGAFRRRHGGGNTIRATGAKKIDAIVDCLSGWWKEYSVAEVRLICNGLGLAQIHSSTS
jgi:hypothetical protein